MAPTIEKQKMDRRPMLRKSFSYLFVLASGVHIAHWHKLMARATCDMTKRDTKFPGGLSNVLEMVGSFGKAGHSCWWTQV